MYKTISLVKQECRTPPIKPIEEAFQTFEFKLNVTCFSSIFIFKLFTNTTTILKVNLNEFSQVISNFDYFSLSSLLLLMGML